MNILVMRTDKPQAEIGLYENEEQIVYKKWEADRKLAETLHFEIQELLNKSSNSWDSIGGLVVYKGPGSFTGLRIGLSTANALAYVLSVPIVAASGDRWIEQGIKGILSGDNDKLAKPEYGAPPRVTTPKK